MEKIAYGLLQNFCKLAALCQNIDQGIFKKKKKQLINQTRKEEVD